jgi:hypothetical protein
LLWLINMTDVLNGDSQVGKEIESDTSQKPIWFNALAELSTEEAEKMIKSVI